MFLAVDVPPPQPAADTETFIVRPPQDFKPWHSVGDSRLFSSEYAGTLDRHGVPEVKAIITGYERREGVTLDTIIADREKRHAEYCAGGKIEVKREGRIATFDTYCPKADKRPDQSELSRVIVGDRRVYMVTFSVRGKLNGLEKGPIRKWLNAAQVCRVRLTGPDGKPACPAEDLLK